MTHRMMPTDFIVAAGRLLTCSGVTGDPLGVLENAALCVRNGTISDVAPRQDVLHRNPAVPIVLDAPQCLITPGLVDAHTHLAWAGSRHHEYALRMQGAAYEEIAAAGGGIVSSMRAVRKTTEQDLSTEIRRRLHRLATLGVTTCEVKSGYGLSLESELVQLRALRAASQSQGVPRVIPTYLALHSVPPEAREHRDTWVSKVALEWLPTVAQAGLAQYVDVYIDRNAFTVSEAEQVFQMATTLGIGIRAHVGQFADVGGALLAARFGAVSVDHMENATEESLQALAVANTKVILLPTASFSLRQQPPPVQRMRDLGLQLVVASDANPGTAPSLSLPLALAFGMHSYGLSPQECILGATRLAAESLGRQDIGSLEVGKQADFVVWDLPHETAILQPWGVSMTRLVLRAGEVLHEAPKVYFDAV